jgi:hypothetical protein
MAYTDVNYKTKKALKEDFARGTKIHCYQPGGLYPLNPSQATTIEGPHYPKPHRWYARVMLDENCYITKIIS